MLEHLMTTIVVVSVYIYGGKNYGMSLLQKAIYEWSIKFKNRKKSNLPTLWQSYKTENEQLIDSVEQIVPLTPPSASIIINATVPCCQSY